MPVPDRSAAGVVAALESLRSEAELAKVRKRLAADEPAIGMRMRDLFDVAKTHTDLPLTEVERLLDHPAYEPRMAAMCVLDFQARRRLADDQREQLYVLYCGRHDRITTWDMVDRAAPRVVGGYLAGRSPAPLYELAEAAEPLRRRTATTATLYFVKSGTDDDLAAGFAIAGMLAGDSEPAVHNAVGIFLKHAGTRDPAALRRFLADHAGAMPRRAVRLAVEKLDPAERAHYLT
ncbi:DNA alkylation repair protein [Haloechinothrix sp. LS1_15]|uniref:DNA alkylation repair protein n=1 Tax=Haloechinothrix sp. LS1_15 TaxID=2652248 RepID=UPI0029489D51|nr:DNA alkylation repair protein [Haloechinothrix sp. LS1_15]MDV6014021.1 DNA alkylation repair protein [Haloechinothrix sp. LS1_15]